VIGDVSCGHRRSIKPPCSTTPGDPVFTYDAPSGQDVGVQAAGR
jgi:hypothetical protein